MSDKSEIIINFDKESDKRRLWAALRKCAGGVFRITIKRNRKRRTNPQNRYYFGVIVSMFSEYMREQGEPLTTDQAHHMLAGMFLRMTVMNPKTHLPMGDTVRSTTELTTEEFAVYIEHCVCWMADFLDIVVPSPGEHDVDHIQTAGKAA